MQSYKVTVAYDGTDYHGWQWQPRERSIDRVLRETFLGAFHQDELFLVGASRTDAGVHAEGQVFRLRTALRLDPLKILKVWNNALPSDILIKELKKVDERFHPQHGVVRKTYEYRFFMERPGVMQQRFGSYVPYAVAMDKLAQALAIFVGTHDFRAFCKEDESKDTVRTIETISLGFCARTGACKITVVGKSFLRYMIRRIVGAALTAACKSTISLKDLKLALCEKRLFQVLPTAPARGLCLKKIEYQS